MPVLSIGRSALCVALVGVVLTLPIGCRPAEPPAATATLSVTAAPPPSPTAAVASVEIALRPLANPAAGFTISYPEGWVYSAEEEQSYIAENDLALRTGNPGDGAMVLVMSRSLRQLESEIGREVTAEAVFSWVALNLFRNRGALIGAMQPRSFGAVPGVGGQVMWVDSARRMRVQGYLAAAAQYGQATVVLGMVEDKRWNVTWPLFDAMLDTLTLSPPGVRGDVARGELIPGQEQEGELAAGWSDHWTYTSPGNEYVAISVDAVAQRWDPYVELYGAESTFLGDDDNGGLGFDARLGAVWLAASGVYTVYVSSYSGGGLYTIRLERVEPKVTALRYGDEGHAVLTEPTAWHVWTFEGQAGEAIDAVLSPTPGLSMTLDLRAPDGRVIGLSADPTQATPRLTGLVLPQSGLYRMMVRSVDDMTGTYRLSVGQLEPRGGGTLTIGQPVSGTVLPGQAQHWVFEAAAGDVVTVTLRARIAGLNSYAVLFGPGGHQLAADDDSGGGRDMQVDRYRLVASGTYTVAVSAVGSSAGLYSLSVELASMQSTPS